MGKMPRRGARARGEDTIGLNIKSRMNNARSSALGFPALAYTYSCFPVLSPPVTRAKSQPDGDDVPGRRCLENTREAENLFQPRETRNQRDNPRNIPPAWEYSCDVHKNDNLGSRKTGQTHFPAGSTFRGRISPGSRCLIFGSAIRPLSSSFTHLA